MKLPKINISGNVGLLLLSVGLALVVWLFAKTGQTEEARGIMVPVVVTPRDERVEVRVNPPSVSVNLRYPKDLQYYISSENFRFEIDTSDMHSRLGLDWIVKSQALSPANWVANVPGKQRIELEKIGTDRTTVEVRMRWNAQLAIVKPDITGEDRLPEGMQLVRPVRVGPHEVWIAGSPDALAGVPRDDVTSKIQLLTQRIDVSRRTGSGAEVVPITLPPGIDIVQPPLKTAEVTLDIQEVQTVREIRGVPLRFAALVPDSVDLQYKEKAATVTVFGPQSLLRQLAPESFVITIVRPREELPGTTKDVALEAHFSDAVPPDTRAKLTIRSIDPKTIRIQYVAKPAAAPSKG